MSLAIAAAAATAAAEKAMNLVAAKPWTAAERSQYCDEIPESPIFAEAKSTDDEDSGGVIARAVRRAEYDEMDSPESMAAECKDKGNAAFTRGAVFYPLALKHYTDALAHVRQAEPSRVMTQLASTVHANLAAVYLARTKYISCLTSCASALRIWPDNIKAAYRAAKAALAMGRAAAALEFCELGQTIDPEAAGFGAVRKEANALLAAQEANASATVSASAERAGQLEAVRAACAERGIQVGPPLYSGMKRTSADPFVSDEGVLHWPVLVLYPEHGTSDYVEAWSEMSTIGELVDMLLPEAEAGPPPAWDRAGAYRSSQCDVFYRSNPCKPLSNLAEAWTRAALESPPEESWKDVKWVRVPAAAPLLLPLVQSTYVVADTPVLYVVPRSSTFYAHMKGAARGGTFATLTVPPGA